MITTNTDRPLNAMANDIHTDNVKRGYWKKTDFHKKLLLVISEGIEMMEAERKGMFATDSPKSLVALSSMESDEMFVALYREAVKGTLEEEAADLFIRSFDFVAGFSIDIDEHIRLKRRYNAIVGVDKKKQY